MRLLDYGANPPPAETAGTGLPQIFGTDGSMLVVVIVVLLVLAVVAFYVARRLG